MRVELYIVVNVIFGTEVKTHNNCYLVILQYPRAGLSIPVLSVN